MGRMESRKFYIHARGPFELSGGLFLACRIMASVMNHHFSNIIFISENELRRSRSHNKYVRYVGRKISPDCSSATDLPSLSSHRLKYRGQLILKFSIWKTLTTVLALSTRFRNIREGATGD